MKDAAIISVVRDSISPKVGLCRQYFFLNLIIGAWFSSIQLLACFSVCDEGMKIFFSSKYGKQINDSDDTDIQETLKYTECINIGYLEQHWKEMYAGLFGAFIQNSSKGAGEGKEGQAEM